MESEKSRGNRACWGIRVGQKYLHNKSKNIYEIVEAAIDCTNAVDGRVLILYKGSGSPQLYAREIHEFLDGRFSLMEEPMEKYGVVTEEEKKASEKKKTSDCPKCDSDLSKSSNVPKCPTHGTEPFEPNG